MRRICCLSLTVQSVLTGLTPIIGQHGVDSSGNTPASLREKATIDLVIWRYRRACTCLDVWTTATNR